ncbi:YihY/virulence factor BrkB family protein [Pseudooceanicola sp.]|uniref:YihY/virulence factor BrkB family protein n=1 Tax=Pseudooceanicola sp. TaxID=1914328 RepID=UPI0026215E24|nr:YihY/virulence factor BrkB family protein [Pseudooceanicola sp.]MDF1854579.1 YihY/virulence factor BrkB family protein [Pseudooceanicola sp.]
MSSDHSVEFSPLTAAPMRGVALWWLALRRVWDQIGEANMGLVAAGVAFFVMLALFPGLAALIAIWGLLADQAVLLGQIELLRGIVPVEVFTLVEAQVLTLIAAGGETLGWAGLLSLALATWSARSGVAALMLGLNTIHGQGRRSGVFHYLMSLLLTLALFGVAIVALGSVVVAPIVLQFVPLGPGAALVAAAVRWVSAIGVLLVGLSLIYRYGPNTGGARHGWATPGAGLAVILWMAVSWGFSLYLANFADYNQVYGSIGAAIALLVWLYASAFVVLLGASLNVQLDRARQGQSIENQSSGPSSARTDS